MTKQKKITLAFILILLFLLLAGFVYFLFLKKDSPLSQNPTSFDAKSETTWTKVQSQPQILGSEGYPEDIRDFLETIRGKESFQWNGDRTRTYQYLKENFPDERGDVLYAIYVAFMEFNSKSEQIQNLQELTDYERLTEINRLKETIFPESIAKRIFLPHPITAKETLLLFMQDYVHKNPYSYSKERKRAFLKKKKELYQGDRFEHSSWESSEFRTNLIQLIYGREMEPMTELEKISFVRDRIEELDSDFWN
ncbi:hypothetical protein P3G55_08035 [Leptospira sp. 96542]|nr:hypothetical protein [Leptospira sp. 96542]